MPATFQAMMNEIFKEEIEEGWLQIYLDDIQIASETEEQDKERTIRVLRKLADNDLYCNLDKCAFTVRTCQYLGLIISKNRVAMDPVKLEGIANWPTPQTVKQV